MRAVDSFCRVFARLINDSLLLWTMLFLRVISWRLPLLAICINGWKRGESQHNTVNISVNTSCVDLSFSDLTPRRRQDAECTRGTDSSAESNSETEDDTLFTCPEDGCVKSFQRFSSLQKHLDGGSHRYALERESPYGTRKCHAMQKIWKAELHLSNRMLRRSFQKSPRRCLSWKWDGRSNMPTPADDDLMTNRRTISWSSFFLVKKRERKADGSEL